MHAHLNKPGSQQRMRGPHAYWFITEIPLCGAEALLPSPPFHLAEVGSGWNGRALSADAAKVKVLPQPLHQILNVRYMLKLPQQ